MAKKNYFGNNNLIDLLGKLKTWFEEALSGVIYATDDEAAPDEIDGIDADTLKGHAPEYFATREELQSVAKNMIGINDTVIAKDRTYSSSKIEEIIRDAVDSVDFVTDVEEVNIDV